MSGDFFSVFPVGEKAAGIFICDVMGRGVRSALITSMIRALVEEHAQVTVDPGELLTGVNHALALILEQARTTIFAICFISSPMWKTPSCGLPTPAIRVRFTSNKVPRVPRNVRGEGHTVNRHAALTPEEFFARVLNDIRHFSKHDAFNDDVCVVGVQVQHTR